MHRIILLLFLLLTSTAIQAVESISALTDKTLYVTGERLHISLRVSNDDDAVTSRVAYIELSDAHHVCVQEMVALNDGCGWADIALPATLHSGNYLLSAYTRSMLNEPVANIHCQVVAVVNPTKISRADNVQYLPLSDYKAPATATREQTYHSGDTIAIAVPSSQHAGHYAISLTREDVYALPVPLPALRKVTQHSSSIQEYIPELEGHIVYARPANDTSAVAETQLVMIGRNAAIFDGQRQPDGTWCYYTSGITDSQPAMLCARDAEGRPVTMEFVSPFAGILPQSLPQLQVYCDESDLQRRTQHALQEQAITDWQAAQQGSPLATTLLSATPKYNYDLDEYTRFSTVREIIIEFVRGVRYEKVKGNNMLYTLDAETSTYSEWPALVLLDGMPVTDIDALLSYYARLLRYVQIYAERFTFGSSLCGGVISFITRQGRLSNFRLNAASRLIAYRFPQDHPVTILPPAPTAGTLYWNPAADAGSTLCLPAPTQPGRYRLTLRQPATDDVSALDICIIIE